MYMHLAKTEKVLDLINLLDGSLNISLNAFGCYVSDGRQLKQNNINSLVLQSFLQKGAGMGR